MTTHFAVSGRELAARRFLRDSPPSLKRRRAIWSSFRAAILTAAWRSTALLVPIWSSSRQETEAMDTMTLEEKAYAIQLRSKKINSTKL